MSSFGVGVIGAGGSAATIHLLGYRANPDVEIVGITSSDRAASESQAAKYGIKRIFNSVDELLADESIQAVSISTPPSTHEPLAAQAVKAGKHVLIEKPVATSLEALDRVRDMARGCTSVVELVHNERFMDFNIQAKSLLKKGRGQVPPGSQLHASNATSPCSGIRSPRYVAASLTLGKSSCQPPS